MEGESTLLPPCHGPGAAAGNAPGYGFRVPLVEMPLYLPYLIRHYEGGGGTLEQREARSLAEPLEDADLVVNCAGLGAVELAADATLEAEPHLNGTLLIHNYGHGGAGITLSWGCAEEVVELVCELPGR